LGELVGTGVRVGALVSVGGWVSAIVAFARDRNWRR
jgi:hypothetical protein